MTRIAIYDTTLRDGSQGEGVNFSLQDKLLITARLDSLDVRAGRVVGNGDLEWVATAPAVPTELRYDSDVALIMRTSGTTGRPKAVLLRHSGTLTGFDAILNRLRATSSADASRRPFALWLAAIGVSVGPGFSRTTDTPVPAKR